MVKWWEKKREVGCIDDKNCVMPIQSQPTQIELDWTRKDQMKRDWYE